MRVCDVCGTEMRDGYCINDGLAYYCSDKCLHSKISKEDYDFMYEMDMAYWTEWEED